MTIEFVDGIADIVVVGPTVRIEFFVLRPDPRADRRSGEQPELVRMPAQTLVLPVEGLKSVISVLERVRSNLDRKLETNPPEIDADAEEPEPSPNFKFRPH